MTNLAFLGRVLNDVPRTSARIERLESRQLLSDIGGATTLIIGDVKFYAENRALWRSTVDGSDPQLLSDFNGYGNPCWFTDYDGTLIFSADGGTSNGRELWRSDGTSGGTYMIEDLHHWGASSSPHDFIWVNGHLLFQASNISWNQTLWVTDGTERGTQVISPTDENGNNGSPGNLDLIGNTLYFEQSEHRISEDSSYATYRYKTDGTVAGTGPAYGGVIQQGVLRVFATDGDDDVRMSSRKGRTVLTGAGAARQVFLNSQFTGIEVYGQLGDDRIALDPTVTDDAIIEGRAGVDTIRGGSGNDKLSAGSKGPVFGGAGNDTISGSNRLEGGDGDDVLLLAYGGVALGQRGNDSITHDAYPYIESVLDGGDGNDTVSSGYSDHDTLRGGNGDDTLLGGNARENMSGGRGDDSLYGGGGDDTLNGNAGADTLEGGPGNDSIISDPIDTIIDYQEPTLFNGLVSVRGTNHGDDIHVYKTGNDLNVVVDGTLTTYVAADVTGIVIDGLDGNDVLWASNGYTSPFLIRVSIYGGGGNDTLVGADGNDFLDGQAGDDQLYGYGGNDTIVGGGHDSIDGGTGDNVILPEPISLPGAPVRKASRTATR